MPLNLRKARAKTRRWRRNHPEQLREINRRNYSAHAAERRAAQAERYAANRAYFHAKNAEFRAANPNYFREYFQRRRLRDAWRKWSTQCAKSRAGRFE
jgi:hypothetical protein